MENADGCGIMPWKEPINGKKVFFSEEVFCQIVGPEPSLEMKVSKLLDDLGFAPAPQQLAPLKNNLGARTKQPPKNSDSLAGDGTQSSTFVPQLGGDTSATLPGRSPRKNAINQNSGRKFPGKNVALSNKGKKLRSETETQMSSLKHDQHIRYLNLFKKCTQHFFNGFAKPPTKEELEELKEFESLQVIVAKEQEQFQAYLHQMAQSNSSLYNFLLPHVEKYVSEKEQSSWKRAELYPRHYNQHGLISLIVNITEQPQVAMTFIRTLLTVGQKSKVVLPELKCSPKCIIPFEHDKIKARFPSQCCSSRWSDSWDHQPVTKDKNVESLLHKYPCQVVTSASVLTRLLDNHAPDFAAAWEIPVVVRHSDELGKVVLLDKPLNPKCLHPCEKKTLYLQKALRAFLCHPQQVKRTFRQDASGQSAQQHKPSSKFTTAGESDLFEADFSMDDLETFGSDNFSRKSSKDVERFSLQSSLALQKPLLEFGGAAGEGTHTWCEFQKQETQSTSSRPGGIDMTSEHVKSKGNVNDSNSAKEAIKSDNCRPQMSEQESEKDIQIPPRSLEQQVSLTTSETKKQNFYCLSQSDDLSSDDDMLVIALPESKDTPKLAKTSLQEASLDLQATSQNPQNLSDNPKVRTDFVEPSVISPTTRRVTRSSVMNHESDATSEGDSEAAVASQRVQGQKRTFSCEKTEKLQKTPKSLERKDRNEPAQVIAAASSTLDSILQLQREMLPQGENTKREQENPAEYLHPARPGESVSYSMWDLAGVSLLVRSSSHGFLRNMRQQQCPVFLIGKPERQAEHGLEQLTRSETVKSWLGCYLRPGSHLVRARINMQNNEIVHLEEVPATQILQPSLGFSAQAAFALLRTIFAELRTLPAGSYLLSHDPGADCMTLKAASGNKRSGYDLHFHYMGFSIIDQNDRTVPWVPVDPTIILPHHWQKGVIPATFMPKDFDAGRKKLPQRQYKQQQRTQHTKKKNKKKT